MPYGIDVAGNKKQEKKSRRLLPPRVLFPRVNLGLGFLPPRVLFPRVNLGQNPLVFRLSVLL